MRIDDFSSRLKDAILVADGAMGSQLNESALPQRCFEELNITQPEAVFRVHKEYIDAGAQIIETNTFGANRLKLTAAGLGEEEVQRINSRGVKIAREAREGAPREVLIAGSIGPLGVVRQIRDIATEEMIAVFTEQAQALEERGVDLFFLETFSDLDELLAAVTAIRFFSNLPIVAQMTFSEDGTASGGVTAADAASKLSARNVQVIGTNCSLGPQALLPVLESLAGASDSIPRSALPNVGMPRRMGDRTVYPKSSPEYFAAFAREAAALGVRIIGGCCGTTPEHIRAIAGAVKNIHVAAQAGAAHAPVAIVEPERKIVQREPESGIWRRIQEKQFVVSVEIDPPRGVSLERIYEQVGAIQASGKVHAIDINSGAMARVGMDALMVASALEARGIETIPHLTTRDLNIIGLQASLLGAWTVGGVRNVLAVTGDPPSVGDYPEISGVFEVDSVGLVRVLGRLNQGMDWTGKTLGGATNFTIGVAVNPVAEDLDYEIQRFREKIEAGAHFAMTQPLFDPEHWRAFEKRLGGKCPIPVLLGIWPLTSYKLALRLNNEVPGIVIPEPILKELEAAGASARDRGFARARNLLDWARTELAGAYLIPPFNRSPEILELFV